MRIMQVMAGAAVGGAETAFEEFYVWRWQDIRMSSYARYFAIIMMNVLGSWQVLELKIHTVPFGGAFDVYSPWKMKQLIRNFNPQIVQTWMSRASTKNAIRRQGK